MDCQMEIAVLSPTLIFVGRAAPPLTATVIASRKAAHPRVASLAPRIYEGGARRAGGVLPHCEFAGGLQ